MLLFSRRRKRLLIRPRPLVQGPDVLEKAAQATAQTQAATASTARAIKRAAGTVWGLLDTVWYLAESLLYLVAIAATIVFAVYGICWLAVQNGTSSPVPGEVMARINEFLAVVGRKLKGGQ